MKNIALSLGILALFMPLASEALSPGEGIVLDRNTSDYIISYTDVIGQIMQSRFVPSTKIDPTLRSSFENQHDMIHYRYTIKNGSKGKQPLIGLIFDPVSSIRSRTAFPDTWQDRERSMRQLENDPAGLEQMLNEANSAADAPNGWSCRVLPARVTGRAGLRIPCSFDDLDEEKRNGLQIGNTLAGFGFSSLDLPGIGIGQLSGFGDMGPAFDDEGPSNEIANQLIVLQENDYVPRPAAVPMITVPDPFDAAVLMEGIRAHVATWPSVDTLGYGGKVPPEEKIFLLDPLFASQLDRHLAAAADAYRLNQPKAGKEHIKTLRKMLKKAHQDIDQDDEKEDGKHEAKSNDRKATSQRPPIARLAARVLDFDLKYVAKRAGGDESD